MRFTRDKKNHQLRRALGKGMRDSIGAVSRLTFTSLLRLSLISNTGNAMTVLFHSLKRPFSLTPRDKSALVTRENHANGVIRRAHARCDFQCFPAHLSTVSTLFV